MDDLWVGCCLGKHINKIATLPNTNPYNPINHAHALTRARAHTLVCCFDVVGGLDGLVFGNVAISLAGLPALIPTLKPHAPRLALRPASIFMLESTGSG